MDSIELLEKLGGKFGSPCRIKVTSGDTYAGVYYGAEAFNQDVPLIVRLKISKSEAERISVPWLRLIGISYDVIVDVDFD